MLVQTLEEGAFSSRVTAASLDEGLSAGERAFVNRLYMGVLERLVYLDHILNRFSKTNTRKMKPLIRNILRLSVYQLLFMDGVPDRAAIFEAGRLAERRGLGALKPFVNGVLRSVQRAAAEGSLEDGMPDNVRLSVPKWIYERVCDSFGKEQAEASFAALLAGGHETVIRLDRSKGAAEELVRRIEAEGCALTEICAETASYTIRGFERLDQLPSFKEGLFTVQDVGSAMAAERACRALAGSGIEAPLIIDVCAAPGGKSLYVAEHFPKGRILARDLTEAKAERIRENIARLGASNIEVQVHDARDFDEALEGRADLVIADLPCSGLGVLGGKPDIKYRVRERDVAELAALQREILDVAQQYVKPGGVLVYSTCTVTKEENEDNTAAFAAKHPFRLESEEQRLFGRGQGEGFYIAVLRRER